LPHASITADNQFWRSIYAIACEGLSWALQLYLGEMRATLPVLLGPCHEQHLNYNVNVEKDHKLEDH
jgi:hypothetical protein